MTSTELTPQKIELINWLVQTVSLHGPSPDRLSQLNAAHVAALRALREPMSEADLRAVIYDSLFPFPVSAPYLRDEPAPSEPDHRIVRATYRGSRSRN